MKSLKDIEKMARECANITKKCKCGHTVILTKQNPIKICSHCKNLVYSDEKELFKYKLNPHKKSLREG